jgi:hypothetical protein
MERGAKRLAPVSNQTTERKKGPVGESNGAFPLADSSQRSLLYDLHENNQERE